MMTADGPLKLSGVATPVGQSSIERDPGGEPCCQKDSILG